MIIAIDPGYAAGKGNAVALLDDDGRLIECRMTEGLPSGWPVVGQIVGPHLIVWEKPQQDGRSEAVPPSVLINLTASGCLLAGWLAGCLGSRWVVPLEPRTWKNQASKSETHSRMWRELCPEERALLGGELTGATIKAARKRQIVGQREYPESWQTHNLLDAAAIGRYAFKTIYRKAVK